MSGARPCATGAAGTAAGGSNAEHQLVKLSARKNRTHYKTFILSDAIFEVEHNYHVQDIVGHGAYGTVCSCKNLRTGASVAVKKIENVFQHRSLAKRTLRELKLLRLFKHENVMSLERVMRPHSENFKSVFMVSELLETDLACVVRSPQRLTDAHCQFFLYQLLRGLKYIHSANVIHRDLKPRNLLVNSSCDLKICDFGLARFDDGTNDRMPLSNYVATRWYRAPEVILSRRRYGKAVDMWSVGCILAELIGRKPLFPGRDSFHQITLVVAILGTPDPSIESLKDRNKSRDFVAALPKRPRMPFQEVFPEASPVVCDLLTKLLEFDPANRITVEEALRHPYLVDLHCQVDEPTFGKFEPDEFLFEKHKLTREDLRALIYQEIVCHHKEDTSKPDEAGQRAVAIPAPTKRGSNTKHKRRHSF